MHYNECVRVNLADRVEDIKTGICKDCSNMSVDDLDELIGDKE